jgi:hypothetical protein
LQRCSGLLNRRARGSTVATHHFMPAWLSSDSSSFVNCRAIRPTGVRVSPSAPFIGPTLVAPVAQTIRAGGFEPPGCRWESCRECHFAALAQLQEALRSERSGWGWKSLTRHHFAHVVQRRDGALKTRTVSVQLRPWAPTACSPIRRDVPLKTERLQVRGLPRGPIWNVHRSSEPGLFAKQCVPSGKWRKSTAFRHSCACSSKSNRQFYKLSRTR